MLPQIVREPELRFLEQSWELLSGPDVDEICVRSLEELIWLREKQCRKNVLADYMVYCYNREAYRTLKQIYGQDIRMTMPAELNFDELRDLSYTDADFLFYGHLPLMVSAQCQRKNSTGCDRKNSWMTLKDRYGKDFYVKNQCKGCFNEIYNGEPLWLGSEIRKVRRLAPGICAFISRKRQERKLLQSTGLPVKYLRESRQSFHSRILQKDTLREEYYRW